MTYDCMSADELRLWQGQGSRSRSSIPCRDCPRWFADAARQAGVCRRPVGARPINARGPAPLYATYDEQRDALRKSWREAKRRERDTGRTMMSETRRTGVGRKPPPRRVSLTEACDAYPSDPT